MTECLPPDDQQPPGEEICGGLSGLPCKEGSYCYYAPEAMCGAADAFGKCEPMPEACDDVYEPVCSCDDKTYGNDCYAASEGVSIAYSGECLSPFN